MDIQPYFYGQPNYYVHRLVGRPVHRKIRPSNQPFLFFTFAATLTTMQHFNEQVKTDWGVFTFYFNKIYAADGIRYHISFIDRDRKAVISHMQNNGNRWVFLNPENCPDWLLRLEGQLSKTIEQNRIT